MKRSKERQAGHPGYVLVFDLGTTYFKGTLFDVKGHLKSLVRVPTPFTNTEGDYSEISVAAFGDALLALAKELEEYAPEAYAHISAVTFATQTNSFVLLDEMDEALNAIVVWNDLRAKDHDAPLNAIAALPDYYEKTGIPGLGPEFAVAKLHWYQIQCPELWERVSRIALISDLLTLRFTDQFVTEAGAAGLTGLMDIHTLEWWPEALEIAGLERDEMPSIVRAGSNLGTITSDSADRFGLSTDCIFIVGCLDQYAGAIGAGNIHAGDISETTGTVLATVRSTDAFAPISGSPIFWGPSAEAGHYYQMVFGSVSANLLEAFQKALPTPMTFAELDALAATAETSLTLPAELGDPALLEYVREWAKTQDAGEAVRAILVGVAHALKTQIEQLCGVDEPAVIYCVGGAAKSRVWMDIKADIVGVPMHTVDCPEPTSLGAALLAVRGTGN